MANWSITETRLGMQPITVTSTVKNHDLGTIVRAYDSTTSGQGAGEFIYLLGAANTLAGLVYSFNATTFQTVVLPSTAVLATPIAVAMSANVASQYGWYQIAGVAVVMKSAIQVLPQVKLYISGTSGRLMPTSASGKGILGAKSANLTTITSTTSTFSVLLNRPSTQHQIT